MGEPTDEAPQKPRKKTVLKESGSGTASVSAATATSAAPTEETQEDQDQKTKKRRGNKRRYTGDQRTHYRWKKLEEAENDTSLAT